LAHAAVIGRTFWQGALQALNDADTVPSARPLEPILAELRMKQLVRVREAAAVQGEQELVFAEAATHEVAYGALSVRVRASLHRVAAEWLERHATSDAIAAVVAHHHERAGDLRAAAA